jgi:CBS domain-containing protein
VNRSNTQQEAVMQVQELMTEDVAFCREGDSGAEAARLMWDCDCGSIPVLSTDGRRLLGVVTDRDLCMAAFTTGLGLDAIRVENAMARPPLTCGPEDDLAMVQRVMREFQVRRVPVVDRQDELVGILSLNDLALWAESLGKGRDNQLREVALTLASVCRHRQEVPA